MLDIENFIVFKVNYYSKMHADSNEFWIFILHEYGAAILIFEKGPLRVVHIALISFFVIVFRILGTWVYGTSLNVFFL